MFQSSPSHLVRTAFKRGLAVTLISLSVLSHLPIPVGTRVEKDLSHPFPCQFRLCGCRSADHCWKKCCCFTASQKVTWAKENAVSLPSFVQQAAQVEVQRRAPMLSHPFLTFSSTRVNTASCCSNTAGSLESTSSEIDTRKSNLKCAHRADSRCVRSHRQPVRTACVAASKRSATRSASAGIQITLVQTQQCAGLTWAWSEVVLDLPPVQTLGLSGDLPQTLLRPWLSDLRCGLLERPPTPPPKLV